MPKDSDGKMKTGDSDYVETYKAMEKCQKSGKAKAIGISNFSKAELEKLLKETSIVCAAKQSSDVHETNDLRRFLPLTRSSATHGWPSTISLNSTKARASTSRSTRPSATRTRSTAVDKIWAS